MTEQEPPHDILAAEEFGIGTATNAFRPTDRITDPHDVLAAEEFAMPAGDAARADRRAAPIRARLCR